MARSLILSSSKINGVAAAFTVPMFRDLCISIMTTYGLYLLISILHTDPWHMFTSFIQYTMLLPSFINILMVYAFCNTHDISWGTKGDNKAPSLGAASGGKSGQKDSVDVELPWEDQDKTTLNAIYDRWIQNINTPAKIEEKKVDRNTFLEDLYKNFRTRTVLFWAFSNAALIITMTNESIINAIGSSVLGPNPYLSVILYSVVFLTVFRSFGSIAYLIGYWGQRYGSCRC